MALATKCPHCNTIFRVAHDQLKLRGGIVRCGACNEVFDGNAALLEPPVRPAAPAVAPAPSPLPPAVPFDAAMAALDTRAATALQPPADEASYTLELDAAGVPDVDGTAEADASADVQEAAEVDHAPAVDGASGFDAASDVAATALHEAPPAAPSGPPGAGYVPPATAYAPSGAPFAAPSAPAYASGIDATLSLPPAPAEDKLELDLDVDLEPSTEVLDGDTPAGTASTTIASPPPASAPEHALQAEHDVPAPQPEATPAHDADADAHMAIESAPVSPFTLDETFQLEPEDVADAGSALEIESDHREPLDTLAALAALADGRREPTWGEPSAPQPPAPQQAAATSAGQSDTDDEDEVLVDLSPAARAHTEAPLPVTARLAGDGTDVAAHGAADIPADAVAGEQEEPGFVKRDRRRQRLGKFATIAMSAGSVLLVGALMGQAATTFRNQLAASVPQLKPVLQSLCAALGCKVELPAQIDYVTIEQGELQTLSENTFSFTTLLRNQATTAQAWPDIELILDDASDKAVLRRVFTPRDYLGPDADLARGFAPHSEQSVKLYFELKQLKASGYHIAVFYP
ncbi:MAG TPA: DUF3426 domain-containing protein [Burkholderiaceae bacterium]|nr:DUF3426 domain-containing protein [Burkholderiaceae bacterium]